MSCPSLSPFQDVYQRIQTVTQLTQPKLAELLGICQASIADAKCRGPIPLDWLLQDAGPVFLRTDQGYIASDHNPTILAHMLRVHAAPAIIPLHGLYLPLKATGRLPVAFNNFRRSVCHP